MADKIRVLIVDNQDTIRDGHEGHEGLRIVLNHIPDIVVAGVAFDGADAVHMARYLRPDVVLMDLEMPVLSGVEATRQITLQVPGTQVIILTSCDTDDAVFEAVRAGAQSFLLKGSGPQAVVAAIRAVQRGESELDPAIARKVLDAFRRSPLPSPPLKTGPQVGEEVELAVKPLTARENEILELIAQGLSNREIASKLTLTEGTIRNHSSRILSKLHAYDRTQAVIKAARQGIVKL
jgi:DNA-binding NarL/FixJ family response regulator